ncbi:hypothetical protein BMF94_3788 [Rhodotorula taiwanensis]|uniref:Dolichyl-diphosphooligosaccharide-protein glycosyltransferase subunit OST5 n=1 Tax=Rhodotorula taiwanensis TaxID=741276 RepID=A0A2S5B8Q4_9BASI|nr:hypothetical protein BMF94_3788 [Rhodotorula taiwanensis]
MSASYARLAAEHASSPPFTPFVPRSALQPLAIILLVAAFILTFAFSTLGSTSTRRRTTSSGKSTAQQPTSTVGKELVLGGAASVAGGVGLVLAFCAIGANV